MDDAAAGEAPDDPRRPPLVTAGRQQARERAVAQVELRLEPAGVDQPRDRVADADALTDRRLGVNQEAIERRHQPGPLEVAPGVTERDLPARKHRLFLIDPGSEPVDQLAPGEQLLLAPAEREPRIVERLLRNRRRAGQLFAAVDVGAAERELLAVVRNDLIGRGDRRADLGDARFRFGDARLEFVDVGAVVEGIDGDQQLAFPHHPAVEESWADVDHRTGDERPEFDFAAGDDLAEQAQFGLRIDTRRGHHRDRPGALLGERRLDHGARRLEIAGARHGRRDDDDGRDDLGQAFHAGPPAAAPSIGGSPSMASTAGVNVRMMKSTRSGV